MVASAHGYIDGSVQYLEDRAEEVDLRLMLVCPGTHL